MTLLGCPPCTHIQSFKNGFASRWETTVSATATLYKIIKIQDPNA